MGNAKKVYREEDKQRILKYKDELYRKYLGTITPEFVETEVRETLELLKSKGVRMAIGSSSKNTQDIVDMADIRKYFEVIVDGLQVERGKPYPDIFLKAAKDLNVDPKETVVVDDGKPGIDAALEGGFIAIGINSSYSYEKAPNRIKSIKEIVDYIE